MSFNQTLFQLLRSSWTKMGTECPWYSVLTGFPKTQDIPQQMKEEFYESGKIDLEDINDFFGIRYKGKRVLDFGSGLGRLSFALADYFDTVIGVDQSPKHIDIANAEALKRNFGNRVSFQQSELNLESMFVEKFDFILTLITLQHIPPPLIEIYIRQFCRLLKHQGKCFMQIPVYIPGYKWPENDDQKLEYAARDEIQMHALPLETIGEIISKEKCDIIFVKDYDRIHIKDSISLAIYFQKQ